MIVSNSAPTAGSAAFRDAALGVGGCLRLSASLCVWRLTSDSGSDSDF